MTVNYRLNYTGMVQIMKKHILNHLYNQPMDLKQVILTEVWLKKAQAQSLITHLYHANSDSYKDTWTHMPRQRECLLVSSHHQS